MFYIKYTYIRIKGESNIILEGIYSRNRYVLSIFKRYNLSRGLNKVIIIFSDLILKIPYLKSIRIFNSNSQIFIFNNENGLKLIFILTKQ
jgi:hypothetical protein